MLIEIERERGRTTDVDRQIERGKGSVASQHLLKSKLNTLCG